MTNITNLLTEHMDIWTAADTEKKTGRGRASGNGGSVYGVKKLRELILELAVRGKLVPQDHNDEPASELLKRIALENGKPNIQITKEEKSYELPQKWEYARLGSIFNIVYGKGLPNSELTEDGYDVFGANGIIGKYTKYLYEEPQLLISCRGAYSGKPNISPPKCFVTSNSLVLGSSWKNIDLKYFYYSLSIANKEKIVTGSAQPQVTTTNLEPFVVGLPPLAEQHRIVAKVDELMALCDKLEQQHSTAQEAHETLVSQLLATLTHPTVRPELVEGRGSTGSPRTEFEENWQRIYAHFDVLFTTEASIDALKQTLLQLAVMGKLVPQDPNDEPARELLKRIQAEKAKLIAEGKLKKEKPLAPIGEDEKPFELPSGWDWVRLGSALEITGGVTLGRKVAGNDLMDLPYLRVANVQRGYLTLDAIKTVVIRKSEIARYQLLKDDLLVTEGGDWDKVGRTAIWNDEIESCLHQNHIFRMRKITKDLSSNWIEMYMNSIAKAYFQAASKQTTNLASINMTQLKNCLLAIPVLNEQHRIVAKVDALMALCDQLKTRIQQANHQQQAIADALVAQALQPATAEIIDLAKYRKSMTCYVITAQHKIPTFGRTQAEKVLAFSQNHIGLDIDLQFGRKVAGPYSGWMEIFEAEAQENDWISVRAVKLDSTKYKYEYSVKPALKEQSSYFENNCPIGQKKELDRLLKLFEKLNTEEAEIIATLFCAWNDFVIDGITATDEQIIQEVRENWHPAKAKFLPEQLNQWLVWLRDNKIVPTGKGCKTIYQQKLIQ